MILNKKQANKLLIDIFNQDVKRLGIYRIGKYNIRVTDVVKDREQTRIRVRRYNDRRKKTNKK